MIAQLDAAAQGTITQWALSQGPWFVMYLLVMYVLWRAGHALFHWGGKLVDGFITNVILPVKDAAIDHLRSVSSHFDGLSSSMTKLGATCDKLGQTCETISEKLTDVDRKTSILCEQYNGFVDESVDDRRKIHERLDSIEQKIGQMPKLPMP